MPGLDIPDLHAHACAVTQRLVDAVKDDQWHDATPCADWDVRELVNHIAADNLWVKPLMDGKTIPEVGDQFDGDVLGDDPAGVTRSSAEEASAAFAEPGAMERPVAVSYGPVPASVYAGHRFMDVLIHGWDLAVATGQDTALDPELVAACWEIVQPEAELFAASGMFGTTVDVPPDAPLQTRLLGLLGRRG